MKKSNYTVPIIIFILTICVCLLIISTKCIGYKKYIGVEFLFAFIGVLIGFALSLFTHVVGLVGKLKDKYTILPQTPEIQQKIKSLKNIYAEMKDDIMFMFASLVGIVLISILSGYAKYISAHVDYETMVLLVKIKDSLVLAIFLLNIYSIKDLISISFKLSKYVVLDEE